MKNVSLILNGVLFLLVAALFYLHFSGPKKPAPLTTPDGKTVAGPVIAYIDIDSFEQNYNYFLEKSKLLEQRETAVQSELGKDQQKFQNMYIKFQQEAELMTEAEYVNGQQQLMTAKDNLDKKSDKLSNELMNLTQSINLEMRDDLKTFLNEYNADGRYAYIMTYSEAIPVMVYLDPAYNITGDVIKGMNERYAKKQK